MVPHIFFYLLLWSTVSISDLPALDNSQIQKKHVLVAFHINQMVSFCVKVVVPQKRGPDFMPQVKKKGLSTKS